MARWVRTVEINATPAHVWNVMADVEKWPQWAASILSVEKDGSDLGNGGSAVVHAKGAPRSRWTVTKWEPGHGFDWETKARGAKTVGGHWIDAAGPGKSCVTLTIEVQGALGGLFKPLIGKGIQQNLQMEAEGLKRQSEAA